MRGTRGFPKLFALAPAGAPAGRSMFEPRRDVPASASGERLRRPSGRGQTRAACRPGQLGIRYPIAAVSKPLFPEFFVSADRGQRPAVGSELDRDNRKQAFHGEQIDISPLFFGVEGSMDPNLDHAVQFR